MGWCHEFGPQIHEGCDHPMVAGVASCTCAECGAECTGKFTGCAGVWARGPRLVDSPSPALPPEPETRARPVVPLVAPADTSDPADGAPVAELASQMLHLANRCDALEATTTRVPGGGVSPEITAELAALGRRLDKLSTKVGTLGDARDRKGTDSETIAEQETVNRIVARLVGRVAALEERDVTAPAQPPPVGADPDEVAALVSRLSILENTPPAEPAIPADLVVQLASLVSRLTALEEAPERLGPLEETIGRVTALEASQADLARSLAEVPAQAQAVALPATTRIRALEGVLAETVQSIGRLSSRVAGLDDLPKQVEAMEQASTSADKLVSSLAKRIDRLSTQVATVKSLPSRIEALEQVAPDVDHVDAHARAGVGALSAEVRTTSADIETVRTNVADLHRVLEVVVPRLADLEAGRVQVGERPAPTSDRTDALVGGLGHAIDMIDQLSHQVAVLEEAIGTPSGSKH